MTRDVIHRVAILIFTLFAAFSHQFLYYIVMLYNDKMEYIFIYRTYNDPPIIAATSPRTVTIFKELFFEYFDMDNNNGQFVDRKIFFKSVN